MSVFDEIAKSCSAPSTGRSVYPISYPTVTEEAMTEDQRKLMEFNSFTAYVDTAIKIYGYPCTWFLPDNLVFHGYENNSPDELVSETGVPSLGTSWKAFQMRTFVNFNPKKSVFYHFNMDPDHPDNKELVMVFAESNTIINYDCILRTAVCDNVSRWGDLFFKVAKASEEGIWTVQKRVFFCRPLGDTQVRSLLSKIPQPDIRILNSN